MKRIFAILLSLALVAGVTACGDKSSGPVGTWTLDLPKAVDMSLAEARKRLDAMPEGERKMAEELLAGKAAREEATKRMGAMQMDFTVSADKTFSGSMKFSAEDKADTATGTWEEKDGKLFFTSKTKNGQPATGEDSKTVEARMAGSNLMLSLAPGMEMALKRK